jgi:Zn-dependent protease
MPLCYDPGFFEEDVTELTPQVVALALTYYVVLLFSVSFHESAHAYAALRMGDPTAQREGRISLNPLVHIDPIGTVLMPLLQFVFSGAPLLAWAKPTPYNPANFRRDVTQARGHVMVAGAGPISNLVLAGGFAAALFGIARSGLMDHAGVAVLKVLATGIQLNVALMLFNLVPIPPLDGSKVAAWGLPPALGQRYATAVEGFGPWLLLLLLIPVSRVVAPVNDFLTMLLIDLAVRP